MNTAIRIISWLIILYVSIGFVSAAITFVYTGSTGMAITNGVGWPIMLILLIIFALAAAGNNL